jgi:hypothetical protein
VLFSGTGRSAARRWGTTAARTRSCERHVRSQRGAGRWRGALTRERVDRRTSDRRLLDRVGQYGGRGAGNVYDWHHSTVHFQRSAVEGGGGGIDVEPEFQESAQRQLRARRGVAARRAGHRLRPRPLGGVARRQPDVARGPAHGRARIACAVEEPRAAKGVVYVTQTGAGQARWLELGERVRIAPECRRCSREKHAQVWNRGGHLRSDGKRSRGELPAGRWRPRSTGLHRVSSAASQKRESRAPDDPLRRPRSQGRARRQRVPRPRRGETVRSSMA